MGFLSAENITSVNDLPFEDVEVPEWGGTVRIRTLSGTERDRFESESQVKRKGEREMNLENIRARLLALCLVDDTNKRLFIGPVAEKQLGRKSAKVLDRLFTKARELNGMSEADVEELTEGFDEGQSESSTSD